MTPAVHRTSVRGLVERTFVSAAVLAWLACSPSASLTVEVKTDAVPGIEFRSVDTEVARIDGRVLRSSIARATTESPFASGVVVADLANLASGEYRVTVRLIREDGTRVLLSRMRVIAVEGRTRALFVLDRACFDRVCPDVGGGPGSTECAGGSCVDPRCVLPEGDLCDGVELCATDADCAAPAAACAAARCVDGLCFALPIDGTCDDRTWCEPELGCRPLERESVACGTECARTECEVSIWQCDGATPTCEPYLRPSAGASCAEGVCDGIGRCGECPAGSACNLGCRAGRIVCTDVGAECMLDGEDAPLDAPCSDEAYCVAGAPCAATGVCTRSGDVVACLPDAGPARLVVEPSRDLMTSEEGDAETLSVRLTVEPRQDVRVDIVVDAAEEVVVEPTTIVLSPGRASMPRTFVARGIDDGISDGDVAFELRVTLRSDDERYDGITEVLRGINRGLVVTCGEGAADCDGLTSSGCEADLASDDSCGSCDTRCAGVVTGGIDACDSGACSLTCDAPTLASCDGLVETGCETDTDTSVDHCGACGNACALPQAVARCVGGGCQIESCEVGFLNCDVAPANGCELEVGASCAPESFPCFATSVGCNTSFSRPNCVRGARLPAGSPCLTTGTCDAGGACLCPPGSSPNDPCGEGFVCNAASQCVRNVFWRSFNCGTAGANGTGTFTGDEACRAAGFARATSVDGWWWWQCGGPNSALPAGVDLCLRYDATGTRCESFCEPGIRSVDCTGSSPLCRTDARRLREVVGDGSTIYRANAFFSCAGNNPGWSLRVRCEY